MERGPSAGLQCSPPALCWGRGMGRRLWPSGAWSPSPHRGKSPAGTPLRRTPCRSTSGHSWGDTELGWAHGRATWGLPGGGQGDEAASPEVAANVGHHVGVAALTQDGDFLLKRADVLPWETQGIMKGAALTQCPHLQNGHRVPPLFRPDRCQPTVPPGACLSGGPWKCQLSAPHTAPARDALCPPSSAEALAPGPHLGLA